ncbi:MAG: hypothetical protein O7D96_07410, partial [SAR324 cluster bacterium]|nr:hypothetical protein [SAR324 cluster bacterium]
MAATAKPLFYKQLLQEKLHGFEHKMAGPSSPQSSKSIQSRPRGGKARVWSRPIRVGMDFGR